LRCVFDEHRSVWCRVALVDATGAEVDEATPNAVAWGAAGHKLLIGDVSFLLRVNAPTLEVRVCV